MLIPMLHIGGTKKRVFQKVGTNSLPGVYFSHCEVEAE